MRDGRVEASTGPAPSSSGSAYATPAGRRLGLVVFLLVFGTCAYFYNGYGWNQTARYDAIWSFVEPGPNQGTVRIDDFLPNPENGFNTGDWARNPERGPHYYANKAPGTTLLGIPFYAALYRVEGAVGVDALSMRGVLVNAYLIHLWVTVLPVALSALFFLPLALRLSGDPARAFGLTIVLYSGTLMLPFSTMMWGHTTAAAFVVMAVSCYVLGGGLGAVAAGLLAGLAVLTDYGAAPVALGLVALALADPRHRVVRVIAGGVLPLLLFGVYHALLFGSPFTLASSYSAPSLLVDDDVLGLFGAIRWRALWGLTLSPTRGLFVYMPVLLLAIVALRARLGPGRAEAPLDREAQDGDGGDSRVDRRRFLLFAAACLAAVFAINLFFNGWHGGISAGARYQIVALPFWVMLLAVLPEGRRARIALIVLGGVSVANMVVIAAVSPLAPDAFHGSPLLFAWRHLFQILRLDLGIDPPLAPGGSLSRGSLHLYPIALMRDWPTDLRDPLFAAWGSFNLGERLFGLRGVPSLAPILLWAGGLGWYGRSLAARSLPTFRG